MTLVEPYFRSSPTHLLHNDLGLLVRHSALLPDILRPVHHPGQLPSAELAFTRGNVAAILEQLFLLSVSIGAITGAVTLLFAGPALLFVAWVVASVLLLFAYTRVTQRGKIVLPTIRLGANGPHPDEQWLFVNGICVGSHWLQSNVDFLSQMFARDVIGVRNTSFGFIFDLAQCLLQRDFLVPTRDSSPMLYELAREALYDPDMKKVVLIAHSQGGIILSLALDALIADIPTSLLKKLEIYTFGNAANHFGSPLKSDGNPLIPIEHFANERDFVAQFGVLNWRAPSKVKNIYHGKVFLRPDQPGHLLNQHYLESLDPSENWPEDEHGQPSKLWSYLSVKKAGNGQGEHAHEK